MKRLSIRLFAAILFSLLHTTLFISPWGEMIEMKFLDLWFNLRGPITPPDDIVVVAIDEDSYSVLGIPLNQPWPRERHIQLLERLRTLGAKKVVFDILFLDPGPDPEIDQKLAEAFGTIPTVIGADYGTIEEKLYSRKELILPLEKFRQYSEKTALVGLPEDNGYIRRFMQSPVELPTLAEAASNIIRRGGPVPRDLINYYGPSHTIPTFSYYQVLEAEHPIPEKYLKDKIVFVGLSLRTGLGPSQKDSYLTPYLRTFGVEIHAAAAGNLITGNWIRRKPISVEASVLGIAALVLSLIFLLIRPTWGIMVLIGTAVTWVVTSYYGFLNLIFIPGAVLVTTVLPFSYLGSTLYYYIITYRRQRQLQKAFQFYLSPEMAREVARNPKALKLGGEKVIATAMFTDIEGFTEISETMPPEKVVNMLNTYFTDITNAVFENRGTLIKFIGDAIFALWGAPIKTEEHARLACETAISIQKEIERFNNSGRFPPLKTRIGINTGPMVVGNLGSKRRFDFTATGDSVNLASRVEGINKYFGTNILFTDSTRESLPKDILYLKIGSIRVVGKKNPVTLYTLPVTDTAQRLWLSAIEEFNHRRWEEAINTFREIALKEPLLKKGAELYLKQIESHRQTPPPPEWQGEIIFLSK